MILGLRTCLVSSAPSNWKRRRRGTLRSSVMSRTSTSRSTSGSTSAASSWASTRRARRVRAACAYWGTADVAAELKRLLGLGAKLVSDVQDVGGGIKVAAVADPFGNHLGVIENPHFDAKAVR